MTSRIIVNNIQSDTGVSTVTFNSNISVNGSVSSSSGGISIGTGVSISSPSANTLKINAGIANSDSVTIGGGNFLYGVPSNAVYDTNGGANVGDYWFGQFGSPSRGNSGTKVMVGAADTVSFVGFAHTNSSNVSIISSIVESRLFSNTAGSESALLNILTKPSTSRTAIAMSIDGSGRVTKPLQPSFCASKNNSEQTTSGTVVFNADSGAGRHNIGGHYNTSTGTFTAPIAGRYVFMCSIHSTNGTYRVDVRLRINGNDAPGGFALNNIDSYTQATGCAVLNLAANDAVTIYNNNSGVWYDAGLTYFSGYFLG